MTKCIVAVECAIEHSGKFLIIQRPQGVHAEGLLSFPGGKFEATDGVEGTDALLQAVKREVFEEVGIKLEDQIHYVTSSYFIETQTKSPVVDIIYRCEISRRPIDLKVCPREVPHHAWLTPEEIVKAPNCPEWLAGYLSLISRQKMTIRPYQPEDVQDLANIYYHTIHKVNTQDYSREQLQVWAPQTSLQTDRWAQKFAKTKPFVAIAENQVVGFAEFEPNGHIDCFYCHHEWIGRGVGSLLMKHIHKKANELGIARIFAEVSITAKPFFERYGFVTVTEQSVVKDGIELTNYKMEKNLVS